MLRVNRNYQHKKTSYLINFKALCIALIVAIALSITGCVSKDPNTTEPRCTTQPADPGSDGPSKPVDSTTPSDPAPSEPVDPSTPSEPVIPSDPVVTEPGHEHKYTEVVTEATCTEDGFTTYSCECGDVYVGNRVTATGHEWSVWVTTKEPTEDATGEATRSCAGCEEKEVKTLDQVIPNHTHSYTSKVTTAATCTKEGVKTYTCSCGGSYTESIEKIPHSYKATVTRPTCTNKGYTSYKCSCGDSYKDNYTEPVDHDYAVTAVREPAMTSEGYTTYTCSTCGDSYKDDFVPVVPQEEFERMVAEATVKYINQFRNEQGDTVATSLPVLTLIAQERAVQLQDNFKHDVTASRELYAKYQYGEWVDGSSWGGTVLFSQRNGSHWERNWWFLYTG